MIAAYDTEEFMDKEENKIINIECNNLTIDDIVSAISKLKS